MSAACPLLVAFLPLCASILLCFFTHISQGLFWCEPSHPSQLCTGQVTEKATAAELWNFLFKFRCIFSYFTSVKCEKGIARCCNERFNGDFTAGKTEPCNDVVQHGSRIDLWDNASSGRTDVRAVGRDFWGAFSSHPVVSSRPGRKAWRPQSSRW